MYVIIYVFSLYIGELVSYFSNFTIFVHIETNCCTPHNSSIETALKMEVHDYNYIAVVTVFVISVDI